jgi:hypothetical protein
MSYCVIVFSYYRNCKFIPLEVGFTPGTNLFIPKLAVGKCEDSFEAIPEILARSAAGDQAWDAEVPQIPQFRV